MWDRNPALLIGNLQQYTFCCQASLSNETSYRLVVSNAMLVNCSVCQLKPTGQMGKKNGCSFSVYFAPISCPLKFPTHSSFTPLVGQNCKMPLYHRPFCIFMMSSFPRILYKLIRTSRLLNVLRFYLNVYLISRNTQEKYSKTCSFM
jgi:hypothetical protein